MPGSGKLTGSLRLADFLSDLRDELDEARSRAERRSLQLEVTEIAVSLDVAVTVERRGEASSGLRARFWVLAGEVGVKGSASSESVHAQHLTLTLRPAIEEVIVDQAGESHVIRRGLDVAGAFARGEERPDLPTPAPEGQ